MTFGEKLYQLRKEHGMSQEELAAELGVSRQAISRWELGEVVPDTSNILAISNLFHVSTDYLLRKDCQNEKAPQSLRCTQDDLRLKQFSLILAFLSRMFLLLAGKFNFLWRMSDNNFYLFALICTSILTIVCCVVSGYRYYIKDGAPLTLVKWDLLLTVIAFCLPFRLESLPRLTAELVWFCVSLVSLGLCLNTIQCHYKGR